MQDAEEALPDNEKSREFTCSVQLQTAYFKRYVLCKDFPDAKQVTKVMDTLMTQRELLDDRIGAAIEEVIQRNMDGKPLRLIKLLD